MPVDYQSLSDEELIREEVKHRRAAASMKSSAGIFISLGATSVIKTGGVAASVVVPLAAYKAYKYRSHKAKCNKIRDELAERNVTPKQSTIGGDVLLPFVSGAVKSSIGQVFHGLDALSAK